MNARRCHYAAVGRACSDDLLQVFHGRIEPTVLCGFHHERFGIPTRRFVTIEPQDVGRSVIRRDGWTMPVQALLGIVQARDVGKRVYYDPNDVRINSMENDDQARQARKRASDL